MTISSEILVESIFKAKSQLDGTLSSLHFVSASFKPGVPAFRNIEGCVNEKREIVRDCYTDGGKLNSTSHIIKRLPIYIF
jgi:hypothetical protein